MNRIQRYVAAKVFGQALYPRTGRWSFDMVDAFLAQTPTDRDFERALQQAHRASVVMGCIEFLIANATSTPWLLTDRDGEEIDEHPILDLLNQPMPGMGGKALLAGWYQSLGLDGNAYGIKVNNRGGRVAGIQYVPHTSMTVGTGGRGQLTHYVYRVDGRDIRLEIDDVIHIRRYVDWERIHYGRSPIAALGPEIWLDVEATRMVAAIMKNRGMPGGILSPENVVEGGMVAQTDDADLETTRQYMRTEYTGDKRGNWLVFGEAMRATLLQYDPRLLDMSNAHNLSEERITSAILFPASVVGYQAGLQNSRVGATQKEFERQAWQGGIIPMQGLVEEACTLALLPGEGLTLGFDLSKVTVLREDENDKVTRLDTAVRGGWMPVSHAKEQTGQEVLPTDEVYLRPVSVTEVPVGQSELDRAREAMELQPPSEDPEAREQDDDDDDPNSDE